MVQSLYLSFGQSVAEKYVNILLIINCSPDLFPEFVLDLFHDNTSFCLYH